jgi:hypothetical protein
MINTMQRLLLLALSCLLHSLTLTIDRWLLGYHGDTIQAHGNMFPAFQRSCLDPWGYVFCLPEELFGREAGVSLQDVETAGPWGYVLCLPEELFGREAGVSWQDVETYTIQAMGMFSAFQRSCLVGRLGYQYKMLKQTQYRPWGYVLCLPEELFGREAGVSL